MNVQIGYAPVNGLRIYYEVHGDTIGTSFGCILPEPARDRQVVAFEQQGYGHTADIADRPFTFEQSADDTAALLEYLGIGQADLFGFSNGQCPPGKHARRIAGGISRGCAHPENLRRFHDKAAQRMRDFEDIPTDSIRAITAPTLVIVGDADVVRPEHAVDLFCLLPRPRLAVLPGTDHAAL
jgi:pimeloyl-ACP methyl ester carboxylesterase